MTDRSSSGKRPIVYLALCLLLLWTLLVYRPVRNFGFVNYDDDIYVTANAHVQGGLSAANVAWAFSSLDRYLWNPLTWLSYMLDYELYGLNAGGYHLTNLIIHLASTAVLFLFLFRTTGALWPSWLTAGLFALHPLHVESVAWIAERKDVLSGLFWMCTLMVYARYASAGGWKYYTGVIVFFILGLMSKPMTVTLPVVMWMLDYWPLRRFPGTPVRRLILEKLPLLALAAIVTALTFYTQHSGGALESFDRLPLDLRIENAVVSYGEYILKTIRPTGLAVFYPHPQHWPIGRIVLSGIALAALSLLVYRARTRYRYLAVGWCWYIFTLLPVIGLIQIGSQAMADRYTYIPLIGLFVSFAWGLGDAIPDGPYKQPLYGAITVTVFLLCTVTTVPQIACWKDSITLFRQAVASTKNNQVAHYNLGTALKDRGLYEEAVGEFRHALRLVPGDVKARNNLGIALIQQGDTTGADQAFRDVLRLDPCHAGAHNNLGMILYQRGQWSDAAAHFREAVRLRPDFANAHYYLAMTLQKTGNTKEAEEHLAAAVRLNPAYGSESGTMKGRRDTESSKGP